MKQKIVLFPKDEESPDIEFQYDDADSMAAEIAEVRDQLTYYDRLCNASKS